tara:strand:- start:2937 stop:3095 length:159 start_codon:yes stop_codon:yes gene_type:complete
MLRYKKEIPIKIMDKSGKKGPEIKVKGNNIMREELILIRFNFFRSNIVNKFL